MHHHDTDHTTIADYELTAARMLAKGDVWGAEYLLAYADELSARLEQEQRQATGDAA